MDSYGPIAEEDGNIPYHSGTPLPPRAMVRAGILITPGGMMRGNL